VRDKAFDLETSLKMQIPFKTFSACVFLVVAACLASPSLGAEYAGVPASPASGGLHAVLHVNGPGLSREIVVTQYARHVTAPVRAYDIEMTKRMHLIVVSDDFNEFQHLHPVLGSDGRFRLLATFPRAALYHLYADSVPKGYGRSVFRFDVDIDSTGRAPAARDPGVQRDVISAGPYSVRLSTTKVPAGSDASVLIAIRKAGEPATDLHPYLGAYAHIVALGVSDLSYTHVHAMDDRSMAMQTGSDMEASALPADTIVPATWSVHIDLPRRGAYKVWIQFKGGGSVYVAPFVVTAY
jgi:hypothetical protein